MAAPSKPASSTLLLGNTNSMTVGVMSRLVFPAPRNPVCAPFFMTMKVVIFSWSIIPSCRNP